MVQDEVTWALDTIKANWPGAYPEPPSDGTGGLYRANRDEPKIIETGERELSFELTRGNLLGLSKASRSPTPAGTEYRNRVETVLDARVEGLTSMGSEWGHIDGTTDLETAVRYAQHALLQARSYPTIEDVDDDEIGSVAYHSLFVEGETDNSQEAADYFRMDWQIRLVGYDNPDA